jgi:hypothetical protein
MTPAEVTALISAYFEQEKLRQREEWRRAAFIASQVINMAGKVAKYPVSADELIRFNDGEGERKGGEEDLAQIEKDGLEILRQNKLKFWMQMAEKPYGEN